MELSGDDLPGLHVARETLAQVDRDDVREVLCMLKTLERQENEII